MTDVSGATHFASHTLEHLSCFLPGLLALGVHTIPETFLNGTERELHSWAAEGLAETCWATYADTPSGLGADEVSMKAWPYRPPAMTTEDAPGAGLPRQLPDDGEGTKKDDSENLGSRWMAHVQKWESDGRPGGKPPGTSIVVPTSDHDKRDWTVMKDGYLLRPEVRFAALGLMTI